MSSEIQLHPSKLSRVPVREILITVAIVSVVLVVTYPNWLRGFSDGIGQLSAEHILRELVAEIDWQERHVSEVDPVEIHRPLEAPVPLPPIDEYALVVDPAVGANQVIAEIFVTTHVSKKGINGLHAEIAREFNTANVQLADGRTAKIRVRKIASGIAYQYISSRTYVPDGFNPVHHLWAKMAERVGIKMDVIRGKTVSSGAGVVMRTPTYEAIKTKYGHVDIKTIIQEVTSGEIGMGYTNPFASSTGLDFLVSVLAAYADGDESRMLNAEVASAFTEFQKGVPFVAQTTLHMKESMRNNGSLDAFVLGHRTFTTTKEFQHGYEFVPYGVGHHYPLYAVGDIAADKREVLELFATFSEQDEYQQRAREYGWNRPTGLTVTVPPLNGETLIAAQRLWKEKKYGNEPVSAVFVSDVSGSMSGGKLRALKDSLRAGSEFIMHDNAIGLVTFSDEVTTVLPVQDFTMRHKGRFHAAVRKMQAGGGTAMYDGIIAAAAMLEAEALRRPHARRMMFVLTDGESSEGLDFHQVKGTLKGLGIPIHTIGYEADLSVLSSLSSLVEAANIKASQGKVGYSIANLINAQM